MMKTTRWLALVALLIFSGIADARSMKSALTVELMNLRSFIKLYHDLEGDFPSTWSELEKVAPDLEDTLSLINPSQRMAYVSGQVELPQRYSGEFVLAITREPYRRKGWKSSPFVGIHEYLHEPCYMIISHKENDVFLRRLSPSLVEQMFDTSKVPLPEPSGLGLYAHEKSYFIKRSCIWSAIFGLAFLLLWKVIKKIKANKSQHPTASS